MRTGEYPAHHSAVANILLTAIICHLNCMSCSGTSHTAAVAADHSAAPGLCSAMGAVAAVTPPQREPALTSIQAA